MWVSSSEILFWQIRVFVKKKKKNLASVDNFTFFFLLFSIPLPPLPLWKEECILPKLGFGSCDLSAKCANQLLILNVRLS